MSDSQHKLKEETFLDRLKVEQEQLQERTEKLQAFMSSSAVFKLPNEDQIDLRMQLNLMERYLSILVRRVRRLTANN